MTNKNSKTAHEFAVPGIRVADMALPPPEWKEPFLMRCPECDQPMWFSRLKENKLKNLKNKKIKYKLSCYQCLMPFVKECDEAEFVDLLNQV